MCVRMNGQEATHPPVAFPVGKKQGSTLLHCRLIRQENGQSGDLQPPMSPLYPKFFPGKIMVLTLYYLIRFNE